MEYMETYLQVLGLIKSTQMYLRQEFLSTFFCKRARMSHCLLSRAIMLKEQEATGGGRR